MTKDKTYLLGAAMAGLLLCAGAAQAQDYYENGGTETVTVPGARHHLGVIYHEQSLGSHGSGSLYSERVSLSERVNYSDLDVSRVRDYRRLESRVHATAVRICARLNPDRAWDEPIDATCVNSAVRNAMARIPA
jgi:UrcA family protein